MLHDQKVIRSVNHSDPLHFFTRTATSLHSSEENLNTQKPRRKSYLNDSPTWEENSNMGFPVRLADQTTPPLKYASTGVSLRPEQATTQIFISHFFNAIEEAFMAKIKHKMLLYFPDGEQALAQVFHDHQVSHNARLNVQRRVISLVSELMSCENISCRNPQELKTKILGRKHVVRHNAYRAIPLLLQCVPNHLKNKIKRKVSPKLLRFGAVVLKNWAIRRRIHARS
jgi:hypothetical protein